MSTLVAMVMTTATAGCCLVCLVSLQGFVHEICTEWRNSHGIIKDFRLCCNHCSPREYTISPFTLHCYNQCKPENQCIHGPCIITCLINAWLTRVMRLKDNPHQLPHGVSLHYIGMYNSQRTIITIQPQSFHHLHTDKGCKLL